MPGRVPVFTSNGDLKGLKDMLNCRVVIDQQRSVVGTATQIDRAEISEWKKLAFRTRRQVAAKRIGSNLFSSPQLIQSQGALRFTKKPIEARSIKF